MKIRMAPLVFTFVMAIFAANPTLGAVRSRWGTESAGTASAWRDSEGCASVASGRTTLVRARSRLMQQQSSIPPKTQRSAT